MKYSAVLVAAFAATVMARAVPGDSDNNPVIKEQQGAKQGGGKGAEEYDDSKKSSDYPDNSKSTYPTDKSKDTYKDNSKDSSYKDSSKDTSSYKDNNSYDDSTYKKQVDEYNQKYYAPQPKKTYDDNMDQKDHKYYSPQPTDYDVKKSCYDKMEWPMNVHKEKPCQIKWQPKHGGEWKDDDDTKVYLYHCKDYSKPHSTVCEDDCGKGSYDKWTPPTDCESSDSDNGAMYRFKFVKKSDESSCTWGEEFPIYGDKYDDKKEAECPPPAPVPECPPAPPSPPAKAPEQPAPSYPAPAAPAAAPEAAPAAAAPEAAPAPAAYPAAQMPTQGVANETAVPAAYPGSSSAIRASLSVIVGVAALVTFAL